MVFTCSLVFDWRNEMMSDCLVEVEENVLASSGDDRLCFSGFSFCLVF